MSFLNSKKGTPGKKKKGTMWKEEERSRNIRTLESRRKISMNGGFATPLDNSGED